MRNEQFDELRYRGEASANGRRPVPFGLPFDEW